MKDQGLIGIFSDLYLLFRRTPLDRNLIVTVYKLEEPESDPTVHSE